MNKYQRFVKNICFTASRRTSGIEQKEFLFFQLNLSFTNVMPEVITVNKWG